MPEILLCNQSTNLNSVLNQLPDLADSLQGLNIDNPETLNRYTPYSIKNRLSSLDRDVLRQLSPMPVARDLTQLSLTLGEDNTLALAEISAKLKQLNIGLMDASTGLYTQRMGGFAGAVKIIRMPC